MGLTQVWRGGGLEDSSAGPQACSVRCGACTPSPMGGRPPIPCPCPSPLGSHPCTESQSRGPSVAPLLCCPHSPDTWVLLSLGSPDPPQGTARTQARGWGVGARQGLRPQIRVPPFSGPWSSSSGLCGGPHLLGHEGRGPPFSRPRGGGLLGCDAPWARQLVPPPAPAGRSGQHVLGHA